MSTVAWAAWVTLVMTVALSTSNPLYLAIILLCVVLVAVVAPRTERAVAGVRALASFGLAMLVISLAIAVVNGSYGDHVLFTVPGPDLPGWIGGLRLGGPVAAEGLAAAAIRGLAILCVLLAFGVFNGAVSPHRVLRTTPAALFHAGLVVTVGLTLLPSSIDDIRRIREMRALRGESSGWRSLPGLVVPAVIGGLERSMRLAEAMEARGYAASTPGPSWPRLVGAASVPLLLAAAWCWFYYTGLGWLALLLALAGGAALLAWMAGAARARHTTSLNQEPLPRSEAALAAASAVLAVAALGASAGGWLDLSYNPFAGLGWPPFAAAGVAVVLFCGWPAVLLFTAVAPDAAPAGPALEVAPRPRPVGSARPRGERQ
ncbi:MAG: CbiQ family ECF transporter T component [Dehalococcoidia bacterium]